LASAGLPVDEARGEDSVRPSYNVAPGYIQPVYRVETSHAKVEGVEEQAPRYVIHPMKWGLIPSWTKSSVSYSSLMKTINCRDDSLAQSKGLWNPIKHKKRCIIPAEGFYEWLKNPGSQQKQPHYVRRVDGGLLFFAGLWDCVVNPPTGTGTDEKRLYSFTIITTASNPQLSFLHDRMPVILSTPEDIQTWLDPKTRTWNSQLQRLMRPFESELTVYPVAKEVGKVGNNSPDFVVPLDHKRDSIKSFFGRQKARAPLPTAKDGVKDEGSVAMDTEMQGKEGQRTTEALTNIKAPQPMIGDNKRRVNDEPALTSPVKKAMKTEPSPSPRPAQTRSAISNTPPLRKKNIPYGNAKMDTGGNKKITSFFG